MKKICFSIFALLVSLASSAQTLPEIFMYQPMAIVYDNSRRAKVNDNNWKMNNQIWVKAYADGRIELVISKNVPMSFYSPGPIDPMDTDLIGYSNMHNSFLNFEEETNTYYVYYSNLYRMRFRISKDRKIISYKMNGNGFTIVNVMTKLNPFNQKYRQQSPYFK